MDGAEYYFFASTSGADIHLLHHDEQHPYGPDSGVAAWVRARVEAAMDRLLDNRSLDNCLLDNS